MTDKNYFAELENIECEVEKKNGLNYISWSDGWAELKRVYPDAMYRKVKNNDTYLFRSGTGGSVECEVTVGGITHCADLAVTDFKNQEIKYEMIKSTDIQNTLQRAFAKAIAMHGIGLYVYRGEDFPDEVEGEKSPKEKTVETPNGGKTTKWLNPADLDRCLKEGFDYEDAIRGWIKDNGFTVGKPMQEVIRHYLANGEIIKPVFDK